MVLDRRSTAARVWLWARCKYRTVMPMFLWPLKLLDRAQIHSGTALRDAILTHPTLPEGLIPPFSSVASTHNAADPPLSKTPAA